MIIPDPSYTFSFTQSDRDEFQLGHLAKKWRDACPAVFDDDDIRVLRTPHQRKYHFYEWLVAKKFYEEDGHISLMENYMAKSHPRKRAAIKGLVSSTIFDWLDQNKSGQPDLFVYHPQTLKWFLCEVKGPGDVIRKNQKVWLSDFQELMQREGLHESGSWYLAEVVLAK